MELKSSLIRCYAVRDGMLHGNGNFKNSDFILGVKPHLIRNLSDELSKLNPVPNYTSDFP